MLHLENDIDAQQLQMLPAATTAMLSCHVSINTAKNSSISGIYALVRKSLAPYTVKAICMAICLFSCRTGD